MAIRSMTLDFEINLTKFDGDALAGRLYVLVSRRLAGPDPTSLMASGVRWSVNFATMQYIDAAGADVWPVSAGAIPAAGSVDYAVITSDINAAIAAGAFDL